MENEILIGIFGLILGYVIIKYFKSKESTVDFTKILNDEKYKVKGRWDK